MPATWCARPGTNTALSTWTVTPLGDRRVEPVAAAGSLVLVVAVVEGAVVDGRLLEGARVVGGAVAEVVSGEPRPSATALRSDRWALMRSTTMNRARNTTSTAAARAVGPGRKLDLPGGVGTKCKQRRRDRPARGPAGQPPLGLCTPRLRDVRRRCRVSRSRRNWSIRAGSAANAARAPSFASVIVPASGTYF